MTRYKLLKPTLHATIGYEFEYPLIKKSLHNASLSINRLIFAMGIDNTEFFEEIKEKKERISG